MILYLWSLTNSPKFGWACALLFAVFCALRLARFNAAIDATDQPRKSAGFLTGIPAPAGAIGAMLPMYLWFITGEQSVPLALAGGALGRVHRGADGVERRDLQLVVVAVAAATSGSRRWW